MYDTRLVEILDGICITCLIPIAVFTFLLSLVALIAILRIRSPRGGSHDTGVLAQLVLCDILLVVCQGYTLKALVTGREVEVAEVDTFCDVVGVLFNVTISVTWWSLTLGHVIKMYHVTFTRCWFALSALVMWLLAGLIAGAPFIATKGSHYRVSWSHAMCVDDDSSLLSFPKDSLEYRLLYTALFLIRYLAPLLLCVVGTFRDVYYGRKRIRSGWSCLVMLYFSYVILFSPWWADEVIRHFTRTSFPIKTNVIVRRAITFMMLYSKPLISMLCLYHFKAEFRSSFLRLIRLEYKLEGGAGPDYERMYTEIEENTQNTTSSPASPANTM